MSHHLKTNFFRIDSSTHLLRLFFELCVKIEIEPIVVDLHEQHAPSPVVACGNGEGVLSIIQVF